jgi:hypothetical protein
MTELPEPLTPADCDLRDFAFMPLEVLRLRDSGMAAVPDAEVFRAAVLAWCVSWHQLPAASLPDDDVTLCRLLGYGRDINGWKRLRADGALAGFVKCSDGRLYHSVVAEKAVSSWQKKLAQRERTAAARAAKLLKNKNAPVTEGDQSLSQSDPNSVTGSKGELREREREIKEEKNPPTPRKRGDGSDMQGFEDFWSLYPRKTAKGAAERAWPKALKEAGGNPNEIVWSLKAALHLFDTREDGRFVPHPATWLNQKRWLDDLSGPSERQH